MELPGRVGSASEPLTLGTYAVTFVERFGRFVGGGGRLGRVGIGSIVGLASWGDVLRP